MTPATERIGAYCGRVRAELRKACEQRHTTREIAASFAVGSFLLTLPTLGTALVVVGAIAYLFESTSKFALLASLAVFNPLVKGGIYAASYSLGTVVLGPIPGVSGDVVFSVGPHAITRLLVGNAVLSVLFAVAGYLIVAHLVRRYRGGGPNLADARSW